MSNQNITKGFLHNRKRSVFWTIASILIFTTLIIACNTQVNAIENTNTEEQNNSISLELKDISKTVIPLSIVFVIITLLVAKVATGKGAIVEDQEDLNSQVTYIEADIIPKPEVKKEVIQIKKILN
jgi:hypothetical protein